MHVTVRILLFVGSFMKEVPEVFFFAYQEVPEVVMAGMADLYLAIGT
jgi:hypothetical protein